MQRINYLKNTAEYLSEKSIQITSVNDKLRNDIVQFNNSLTKIFKLKNKLKTATLDVIQIVSEFTFLFWLDNFEPINEKRIEFGETYKEDIQKINNELFNLWDPDNFSPHDPKKDSLSYIIGLDSKVTIIDQGQSGSTTFNYTKSMTSTSTPKDFQTNTSLQLNQKSTIRPDKPIK